MRSLPGQPSNRKCQLHLLSKLLAGNSFTSSKWGGIKQRETNAKRTNISGCEVGGADQPLRGRADPNKKLCPDPWHMGLQCTPRILGCWASAWHFQVSAAEGRGWPQSQRLGPPGRASGQEKLGDPRQQPQLGIPHQSQMLLDFSAFGCHSHGEEQSLQERTILIYFS